ncbi:GTP-binding protein [Nitrospira moscoviensis]|uniref:CobW/HypB/UreG nucleotide-binding domain-containing protein n=1 Tax=Nitrospira moscoviensis TaxID=42253 RepID=A0A0K2GFW4_NITMO|nr:GTP-binding protein [Nitrospira moscoviensis]ALA59848.1 hypothetical protein NITMOv2_3456 [Nitrospira moscoviensis]
MSIKRLKSQTAGTPIYVIAGFLGSGKTTLLKRALAYELDRGVKPAVLMNEFGEVDVDGALLHEHPRLQDVELQSLLSGCICCDLSGEFTDKVGHLMKETQGAPLFIETTGLADTGQVVAGVQQALAEHQDKGRLASVIVMVDAPRFLKLGAFWPAAEDHLKQADTVVLNKLDQIDGRQADLVERRVRSVNPRARVVRAVHAESRSTACCRCRKKGERRSSPMARSRTRRLAIRAEVSRFYVRWIPIAWRTGSGAFNAPWSG